MSGATGPTGPTGQGKTATNMVIALTQGYTYNVDAGSPVVFDTVHVDHGGSDITFTGTTGSPSSDITLAPGNVYWVDYEAHFKASTANNISVQLTLNGNPVLGSKSSWHQVSVLINPSVGIIIDLTNEQNPAVLNLVNSSSVTVTCSSWANTNAAQVAIMKIS
jgi:hypothetical protein